MKTRLRQVFFLLFLAFLVAVLAGTSAVTGSQKVTARTTDPRTEFGFNLGDDYQLANYTQVANYWRKLDQQSDRLTVVEYGKSSEGRAMLMAIITSPANHARLDHYRDVSKRLALAEGLTDEQARALAAQGKAVVWIDAGLHASEVANVQALTQMAYEMATRTDPETLRILDEVILLAALSNPDGLELVGNWYMREPEPTKRSTANLPVLYQKYIGHDNNRESLLCNMPECEAIARVLYREWFPQIMYAQHQTGPAGAVLFVGAMRDPSNPHLDPLLAPSVELVGAAVHTRFVAEGKPGAVSRSMASYQNWRNGGHKNTATFHNQIGILSEISGNPTPTEIDFIPQNLVPTNDNPFPVHPQQWHFRQTIEYLLTAERAILDIASEHRDDFLFNIYRMGRNSIEKGSRDHWTMTAGKVAAVQQALARDNVRLIGRGGYPAQYYDLLRDPAARDARGYILPSDQADFLTATKFVNGLIKNGVSVLRATRSFQVAGKTYPAGSYVVKTAQAFRPHVVDVFEPQDYPNDFAYPGGPPIRPYDITGYTLAYLMGIKFDRILDGFDGPFEPIQGFARTPGGTVTGTGSAGFLLSHEVNEAATASNLLLQSGETVFWLKEAQDIGGTHFPAGTTYVPTKSSTLPIVRKIAAEVGLTFIGITSRPRGDMLQLKPVRLAVVDVYGGSAPSGWLQWMFGQYKFPYDLVYPTTLDAGNLAPKYDVLVLEDGIVSPERAERGRGPQLDPQTIPSEHRAKLGAISRDRTIPQLRQFLADGGSILAIGSSAGLAYDIGAPVANALVEPGTTKPLPPQKFYIPGSVLDVRVDTSHPLGYGMPELVKLLYINDPVFRLEAATPGRVAWVESEKPVCSGWAWGQEYLKDGVFVIETEVGKGKLFLFGPQIAFRAHTHATFKFLFNGIHYGGAQLVRVGTN